ncbi:hypothetical protein [Sphingobacterium multivorum]|uniref:hypothetical protein n=1 Tax=Sphingobacterium multivorum TaxID=28454 RepID=UPI003DA565D5
MLEKIYNQVFEIEKQCIRLKYTVIEDVYGDSKKYDSLFGKGDSVGMLAAFSIGAGISSEVNISKSEFEQFYNVFEDKVLLNKLLYIGDVGNVIGTLQNSVIEVSRACHEFFKLIGEEDFLIDNQPVVVDGLQSASGEIVSLVSALLNYILIGLYSQLDFMTKIVFELENAQKDFSRYKKLVCQKITYGDKNRVTLKDLEGGVFSKSEYIMILIYLRNEIVHNSSINSVSRIYQEVKDGKIVNKFILLPDFKDGLIQSFVNRKRFFRDDNKANDLIPKIVDDVFDRIINTMLKVGS